MRVLKRFFALFLVLTFCTSSLLISTISSFAEEGNSENALLYGTYSGQYDNGQPMTFSISSVDLESKTFTGHVRIENSFATIDKDVSGSLNLQNDYFECSFSFSYHWWITNYDAVFTIKIDPFNGVATGDGGGGILIYSDEILMNTTVNKFYNKTLSYCEDDMKMCMDL
ncbi:MAG: hypothetical protein ACI4RR_08945 [Eubacterium sp.]